MNKQCVGLSHVTGGLSDESFKRFEHQFGQPRYAHAMSILLTRDGVESDAADRFTLKHDLEGLSHAIGLPIRIVYKPPRCSKYRSIERRFFPRIERERFGLAFDCLDPVEAVTRIPKLRTGLWTTVAVIQRVFATGKNATQEPQCLRSEAFVCPGG